MKTTVYLCAGMALAGCAPKPVLYASNLASEDPKYNTPECQEIRMAALNFNEKVGSRAGIGLAAGLLLGPLGIPLAIAVDADHNETRRLFAREVHLRCSSLPLPKELQGLDSTPVGKPATGTQ